MKRTKFIALALAVSVMLMGAGYAYWTQDLTITNTVDTGKLDVQFSNTTLDLSAASYMDDTNSSFEASQTDGEYNVVMNLFEAYPGADIGVTFDLVNTGTLKANVRDFAISSGDASLMLCKSLIVDGNNLTTSLSTDATLEDALAIINDLDSGLNQKGVGIEPVTENNSVTVEMDLEIDPAADSQSDSDPYLAEDDADAIKFTISATAYQYNHN